MSTHVRGGGMQRFILANRKTKSFWWVFPVIHKALKLQQGMIYMFALDKWCRVNLIIMEYEICRR